MTITGTKTVHTFSDPDTWVNTYGDMLFRYAMMRIRDSVVAEDLVQETFLGAIRNQNTFTGQASEQNWLYGILKHKIIDHYRKSTREQPTEDTETDRTFKAVGFDERGHWVNGPSEWNINPANVFEDKEFHRTLASCLEKMPKKTADAFIFREVDGLSGKEICQVLNVSSNNFWVMLHRARLQLRQCLESNWLEVAS